MRIFEFCKKLGIRFFRSAAPVVVFTAFKKSYKTTFQNIQKHVNTYKNSLVVLVILVVIIVVVVVLLLLLLLVLLLLLLQPLVIFEDG